MVELASDPVDAKPVPGKPWAKRLKYTTVGELLSDYEQSNLWIGRTYCPVSDYLRAHLNDPIETVEAYVYAHPQWGPFALCETMYRVLLFNNSSTHPHGETIAQHVQHFIALEIAEHKWGDMRGQLSAMLKSDEMRFVSPEAAYVILAYLASNHPNPRKFLEKDEVRAKFPPDLDIAAFAAPDFEDAI